MHKLLFTLFTSIVLVACNKVDDSTRKESSLDAQPLAVPLNGKAPWQVTVSSDQSASELQNGQASIKGGDITVQTTDTSNGESKLTLRFKDSWSVQMTVESQELDLDSYVENGALAFELNPQNVSQAGLSVNVNCFENCQNAFRLREWAMEHEGQGWQSVNIALSCLLPDQNESDNITMPFVLSTGGTGEIEVRNVRFVSNAENTLPCPKNQSVTPVELNEPWATNWWKPRHEEKLEQAANSRAELVLIGDSITHSWEDAGKKVWEQQFGDIDTLNLGFAGDRTENVLWRLNNDELQNQNAKLTMIMIGTNNTGHRMEKPEAIRDGVAAIIDKVKTQMPDTHIVLQAIFPRGATDDDPMRQNNQAANELLKQLAKEKEVEFVNFNPAFLEENGQLSEEIMPDLLHPNEKGYEIWAQQMAPYVDKYVRQK